VCVCVGRKRGRKEKEEEEKEEERRWWLFIGFFWFRTIILLPSYPAAPAPAPLPPTPPPSTTAPPTSPTSPTSPPALPPSPHQFPPPKQNLLILIKFFNSKRKALNSPSNCTCFSPVYLNSSLYYEFFFFISSHLISLSLSLEKSTPSNPKNTVKVAGNSRCF